VLITEQVQLPDDHPIVQERAELMRALFDHFGCNEMEESDADGLPLVLYKKGSVALFSCSLYHQPSVWHPHVTIAIKFAHLEERHDTSDWPKASASVQPGFFYEKLSKA
jgi:hypothetical protein